MERLNDSIDLLQRKIGELNRKGDSIEESDNGDDVNDSSDALDDIKKILEYKSTLQVDSRKCDTSTSNQPPEITTYSGKGFEGLHQCIIGVMAKLDLIQESICDIDSPVLAFPYHYGLREQIAPFYCFLLKSFMII